MTTTNVIELEKNSLNFSFSYSETVIYIDKFEPIDNDNAVKIAGHFTAAAENENVKFFAVQGFDEVLSEQKIEKKDDGQSQIQFTVTFTDTSASNYDYFVSFILKNGKSLQYICNVDCTAVSNNKIRNYRIFPTEKKNLFRITKIAPFKSYKVSVIIPVYNTGKYLEEAINSVISQSIGFKNIQLILVNDGSSDNSESICLKFKILYPNNVIYVKQENAGVSAARNLGLNYVAGDYTCMLDSDDKYEENFMEECIKLYDTYPGEMDYVITPMKFFEASDNLHPLSERLTLTCVVYCDKNPDIFSLSSCCGMFLTDSIKNTRYDTKLKYGEDAMFVTKTVLRKMKIGVVCETKYLYRKRFDKTSAIQNIKSDVNFYDRLELLYKNLFDYSLERFGHIPQYVQHVVMHDMQGYDIREIPEEVKPFIDIVKLKRTLQYLISNIDDDIIKYQIFIDYWTKAYLLKIKHGEVSLNEKEKTPNFFIGKTFFEKLGAKVWLQITEEKNGIIHFGGYYTLISYEYTSLIAKAGDILYKCAESPSYHISQYYLGEAVCTAMQFDVYIPFEKNCTVSFYLKTNSGRLIPVNLCSAFSSRLTASPESFFVGETAIIKKISSINTLSVEKFSFESLNLYLRFSKYSVFKNEIKTINKYLSEYKDFIKKRIWLFMDRIDQAGDNAEALFNYCKDIDDGIDKYFVISDTSADYKRIKKYGNIVSFGSQEHKMLLLFAEKFISSHTLEDFTVFADDGFYKSLVNCEKIFLQHGVILHDLSDWANRYKKNFSMFITSAEREYEAVTDKKYDYSPAVIKLTGLPRFDLLANNPEKIILFMPTWRRNITDTDKNYDGNFRNTDYFKCLNDFINDSRLLDALKKYGYKLYFKPHPNIIPQIYDFDIPSEVSVVGPDVTYNKLYETGSLCVTDFSSAVFDFAYLKKPVLYYQKVPNHLKEDYFDYETMGFGDVVSEQERVVDKIINIMENGCTMEDKYKERVDNFFAFKDKNNCKRVYNEILKLHGREKR